MTKTITLDLDQLRNPTALDPKHFFYKEEMEKVFGLIDEFVSDDTAFNDDLGGRVFHQIIPIIGDRGAGKTTFVKTIPNYYKAQKKDVLSLKFMDLIDPTTLEKGMFLPTVISRIFSTVEHDLKADKKSSKSEVLREVMSPVTQKFKMLINEDWQSRYAEMDDEFLAHEMMNTAHDGLDMGDAIHKFLNKAAGLLGVKAIVLPIDDTDTMLAGGFEVLEAVRRYLVSPRLIIVMTGNLDLFQDMLFNQFYKETKHLPLGSPKRQKMDLQIKELAHQYLAKLLPSPRRVVLHPMVTFWDRSAPERPCSIKKGGSKAKPVDKVFAEFLKKFLGDISILEEKGVNILDPRHNPYAALLLPNNRHLMAVFQGMLDYLEAMKKRTKGTSQEALRTFLKPYWHVLSDFGLDPGVLIQWTTPAAEHILAEKLIQEWDMPHPVLANVGSYTDQLYGERQRNPLVALITLILSKALQDSPYRMLHSMLLLCEVPRGFELLKAALPAELPRSLPNYEVLANNLGLSRDSGLVFFMERYGQSFGKVGQLSYIEFIGAEVYRPMYECAIQRLPGGFLLYNPYKYLAITSEVASFIQIGGRTVDDIVRFLQTLTKRPISDSDYWRLAEKFLEWHKWIKDQPIKKQNRPSIRTFAFAIESLEHALVPPGKWLHVSPQKGINDLDGMHESFIRTLAMALHSNENDSLRVSDKMPDDFDIFLNNTFKDQEANTKEPRSFTEFFVTNPLIRYALTNDYRRHISWGSA